MSKKKEKEIIYFNTQENPLNQNNIPISSLYINHSIKKGISKSKKNIKEKEHITLSSKMKFSYIPKNSYAKNNIENLTNNNLFDSKSSIINTGPNNYFKNIVNKEKQNIIALSDKIEKNIIPIFDKKLLIKNKQKANTKKGKNCTIINKGIMNNKISNEKNDNNKGFILITTKEKRTSPIKYKLNLDDGTKYNNNSIMFSKMSKYSPENKTKIIKFDSKINYTNINTEQIKGKIITLDDISIINDNKNRILKKCTSKPNYYADNNINNNHILNSDNNNFIHNILYNNNSNKKFNFEKYKKQQHMTSNIKNNNLYSYQKQAPHRNINHLKNKASQYTHNINLKNINSNNYPKLHPHKQNS